MKLIEEFICGKKNDPASCEDVIVITGHFMAVIDGATSKTCPVVNGQSGGRFAAQTVAAGVQSLPRDMDGHAAMAHLSRYLAAAIADYPDFAQSSEKPSCSLAIYSAARKEVWRVGDVGILLDGTPHMAGKQVDETAAAARAAMIAALLAEGETLQSLKADDKGRAFILPLLSRQHLFANRAGDGFGYGVMNGGDIPAEYIDIYAAQDAREIVLASDGYPRLCPTWAESERELAFILREDPLLYKLFPSTKGLQAGQVSFDDRSYLRFAAD